MNAGSLDSAAVRFGTLAVNEAAAVATKKREFIVCSKSAAPSVAANAWNANHFWELDATRDGSLRKSLPQSEGGSGSPDRQSFNKASAFAAHSACPAARARSRAFSAWEVASFTFSCRASATARK